MKTFLINNIKPHERIFDTSGRWTASEHNRQDGPGRVDSRVLAARSLFSCNLICFHIRQCVFFGLENRVWISEKHMNGICPTRICVIAPFKPCFLACLQNDVHDCVWFGIRNVFVIAVCVYRVLKQTFSRINDKSRVIAVLRARTIPR